MRRTMAGFLRGRARHRHDRVQARGSRAQPLRGDRLKPSSRDGCPRRVDAQRSGPSLAVVRRPSRSRRRRERRRSRSRAPRRSPGRSAISRTPSPWRRCPAQRLSDPALAAGADMVVMWAVTTLRHAMPFRDLTSLRGGGSPREKFYAMTGGGSSVAGSRRRDPSGRADVVAGQTESCASSSPEASEPAAACARRSGPPRPSPGALAHSHPALTPFFELSSMMSR